MIKVQEATFETYNDKNGQVIGRIENTHGGANIKIITHTLGNGILVSCKPPNANAGETHIIALYNKDFISDLTEEGYTDIKTIHEN